jgi:hypothetical protein
MFLLLSGLWGSHTYRDLWIFWLTGILAGSYLPRNIDSLAYGHFGGLLFTAKYRFFSLRAFWGPLIYHMLWVCWLAGILAPSYLPYVMRLLARGHFGALLFTICYAFAGSRAFWRPLIYHMFCVC